jgi:Fe-S cluster assembly protein SufD
MASVVEQRTTDVAGRGDRYVREFESRAAGKALTGPAWLRDARIAAMARFSGSGFPTTRDEEWRFTPITPIVNTAFVASELLHVQPASLAPYLFGAETAAELVFVNGVFVPALSRTTGLPAGVEAGSLATLLAGDAGRLETALTKIARHEDSPFTALNTALFADGAYVHVARGAVVDAPIHVMHYSTVSGAPSVSHPRLVVVVDELAQAKIIETYAGPSDQIYWTNAVSEFSVGESATVAHYRVQRESLRAYHVAAMQLRTGRASVFTSQNLVLGGAIVRNDIGAVLDGEGGETTLNGLYVGAADRLLDTHTTIDHATPHNVSHELYKGVLGGRARGVFNGKILVRIDAQKTDAKQTNKALLLSDAAQINTKPQLEIFADDVKCTHGATVGQLDPEMLFYLRARGLGVDEARALLIRGFAGDIVDRVKFAPLRDRLDEVVLQLLPREGE